MHFDPTEDQAMLKAAVERCVGNVADLGPRRAARANASGFSAANWARLADAGVLAMPVSSANGGLGGGMADDRMALLLAMEAIGRALVPEPVLDVAVIAGSLLDSAGSPTQQESILAPMIAGKLLVSLAHAERAARLDLGRVETTLSLHGQVMKIDGAKIAVMAGGAADRFIVSARCQSNIHFWLVRADAPGVERRDYRLADGSVAAEIMLRGVTVRHSDRLAGGFDTLENIVAIARAAAAAEMLGIMTLLFDATLEYVKTRVQFGKPIGSFQVIQHRMADAFVLVELARSQVVRAGLAPPADFGRAAAGAKAFVAEAALSVAHTAVQLHGGMGITDELVIGHGLKRLRVLALTFGDIASAIDDYRSAA
jgi:alkylation response protein AidB-like acyl-CoA dehydrogenase